MSTAPAITTERLCLRPVVMEDAIPIQRLAGRREIAEMTRSIPHPLSLEQTIDWLTKRLTEMAEAQSVTFSVTLKSTTELIGAMGLHVDVEQAHAEMGFWIGMPWWGQGYATEAARAVIRYGFEVLGLNRIHAHHMTKNPASGRVLEKAGMQREGLLRQAIRKWDNFEDVVVYGILREDWTDTKRH